MVRVRSHERALHEVLDSPSSSLGAPFRGARRGAEWDAGGDDEVLAAGIAAAPEPAPEVRVRARGELARRSLTRTRTTTRFGASRHASSLGGRTTRRRRGSRRCPPRATAARAPRPRPRSSSTSRRRGSRGTREGRCRRAVGARPGRRVRADGWGVGRRLRRRGALARAPSFPLRRASRARSPPGRSPRRPHRACEPHRRRPDGRSTPATPRRVHCHRAWQGAAENMTDPIEVSVLGGAHASLSTLPRMTVVAGCASLPRWAQRLGRVAAPRSRAPPSRAAFNPRSPHSRRRSSSAPRWLWRRPGRPRGPRSSTRTCTSGRPPSAYTYAEGKAPPDSLAEVSSAESLLEQFAKAGVDGALVVQPINLEFDHSYVSSVIDKYPGKFVGCCLADPTEHGGGVDELRRLLDGDTAP